MVETIFVSPPCPIVPFPIFHSNFIPPLIRNGMATFSKQVRVGNNLKILKDKNRIAYFLNIALSCFA